MDTLVWLIVGIISTIPLLLFANKLKKHSVIKLLGRSLIIAAIIYIGFALAWGNTVWLGIEIVGVFAYGIFYWLAIKHHPYWLAIGWLAHPAWDFALHLTGPGAHIALKWYALACISFDIMVASYIAKRFTQKPMSKANVSD